MPSAGDAFLGSGGLPISHNPLQRINFSPPKIKATLDDIIDAVIAWVKQQLFPAIKKITGIDLGFWLPNLRASFPKVFPFSFGAHSNNVGLVSLAQFQQLLDGLVNDGLNGHTPAHAIAALRAELAKARADVAQAIQDGIHFDNQDTGIAQALQKIGLKNLLSMLDNGNFEQDMQSWFDAKTKNFIGTLDAQAKILTQIVVGGVQAEIQAAVQNVLDKTGGKVNALLADAESRLSNIAKEGDALAVGVWKDATKLATTVGGELTTVEDGIKGVVDHVNASVGVAAGQTIDTIENALTNFRGSNIIHDIGLDGNEAHQQLRDIFVSVLTGQPTTGSGISDVGNALALKMSMLNSLASATSQPVMYTDASGSPYTYTWPSWCTKVYYAIADPGGGASGGSILLHGNRGTAGQWTTGVLTKGTDFTSSTPTFDVNVGIGGAGGSTPGNSGSNGASQSSVDYGGSSPLVGGGVGVGGVGTGGTFQGQGAASSGLVNGVNFAGGSAQNAAGHKGHSPSGGGAGGNIGYSLSPGGAGADGVVILWAVA